jgi:hypothetical protein
MPEATTLYSVTGVVLVGLVAWVAMVLKQAKEPWARPAPPEEPAEDLDAPESKKADVDAASSEAPKLDADDTARATPVALSEGRQKAADAPAPAEDEPAATEEEAKKEEA